MILFYAASSGSGRILVQHTYREYLRRLLRPPLSGMSLDRIGSIVRSPRVAAIPWPKYTEAHGNFRREGSFHVKCSRNL